MSGSSEIETEYLVIGAGALGMGFVDTLIQNCDADVVMIDRQHRPGGHWLDSYPFVQLHQPSMNYGVNSTPLGQGGCPEFRGTSVAARDHHAAFWSSFWVAALTLLK
jgi:cation diffusion facilitator CzcD-associated flavoprotein CzcO